MDDSSIHVEHNPSPAKLDVLGVYDWPIWRKDVSRFTRTYAQPETCYILRGQILVTPAGGQPMQFGRGDLIRFPAGLSCTWDILEPVENHYDTR